jgi:hypothetical protein
MAGLCAERVLQRSLALAEKRAMYVSHGAPGKGIDRPAIQRNRAKRRKVPVAHRFCRSSYFASRRLYVTQRMRRGFGGKSYSSSVAPLHSSCNRLAILLARSIAR